MIQTSHPLLDDLRDLTPEQRRERLRAAGDEAERLVGADLRGALDLTERLVVLADEFGDAFAGPRARRARAFALCYAGRFEEALGVARQGISQADEAGGVIEAARLRLGSMQALGELGRLDEAVAAGEAARAALAAAGELALAGRADINLGIVHQRRDDPRTALSIFERARPLLATEPHLLGHVDNGRGEALLALNEFAAAEEAFTAALASFERAGAALLTAIAEGNLADLAVRQGRLQRALYHFERARRHLEGEAAAGNFARLLAEQADALAVLGLPREALGAYERALPDLDRFGLAMQAARARAGLGLVLLRLGRPAEAETALAAAAKSFQEIGNQTARARVDLVRAELAADNGRRDEAQRMVHEALAALHGRPVDAALARLALARLALRRSAWEEAEADLTASLVIARRLDLAPLLAEAHQTLGTLRQRQGRPGEAVAALDVACEQIERVRGTLQAQRYRAAFLGNRIDVYEQLLAMLLEIGELERAFTAAELARSRSLMELIERGAEPSGDGVPMAGDPGEARLLREVESLRSELSALYSRLGDEQAPRVDGRWHEAVHKRESRLDELESRLETTRGMGSLYPRPPALAQVQALLDERTAMVEYVRAGGELLAMVIDRGSTTVHRDLGRMDEIEAAVQRVQFQINRALRPNATGARLVADCRRELAALHAALIAPLVQRLEPFERLLVSPCGSLHLLPFHALWDGERYLVQRWQVQSIPSAALAVQLAGRSRAPLDRGTPLVVGVADAYAPRIAEEARRVAEALGRPRCDLLIDGDAEAEAVYRSAREAPVIHFACHGRFSPATPAASGLRLADRWLTMRDICSMQLSAELVTLSGCETGASSVRAGDEILGLLRGFFAAGAGSVLVSLWKLSDEMACDLMPSFYRRTYGGAGTGADGGAAAALRAEQLRLLEGHAHPAHWAPFALVGLR